MYLSVAERQLGCLGGREGIEPLVVGMGVCLEWMGVCLEGRGVCLEGRGVCREWMGVEGAHEEHRSLSRYVCILLLIPDEHEAL